MQPKIHKIITLGWNIKMISTGCRRASHRSERWKFIINEHIFVARALSANFKASTKWFT